MSSTDRQNIEELIRQNASAVQGAQLKLQAAVEEVRHEAEKERATVTSHLVTLPGTSAVGSLLKKVGNKKPASKPSL